MDAFFVVQVLLAIVGVLVSAIGSWIALNIHRLTGSVENLNKKMEVLVSKVDSHERRIERLETRR